MINIKFEFQGVTSGPELGQLFKPFISLHLKKKKKDIIRRLGIPTLQSKLA